MSRATLRMRLVAKRLMRHEAHARPSAAGVVPAAFQVCEQLRPSLAMLTGAAGYRALLGRALVLASANVAWLRALHVRSDGSLEGWDELAAQVGTKQAVEGAVELVAQLLGLLAVFIGETLTLRLIGEVWPKVALGDLDGGNGDGNEKAN
ncbi:MAG TPA: hypothetical protein VM074_08875 [Solimonas sp.]|nr:hypothetical protein [Solimonas sp.]